MGKKNADAMQFWTVDEFNTFLSAVSNKPQSVVMFSLLFWTGIRSGELLRSLQQTLILNIVLSAFPKTMPDSTAKI